MKIKSTTVLLLSCFSMFASDAEVSLFMPVPASGSSAALESRSYFYDHINRFLDWVMSFQNLKYETSSLKQDIQKAPLCLLDFEKQHGFFSSNKPLIGQYTPSKEDVRFIEEVLKKIDEEVDSENLRLFYLQEVLSKALAYRHLTEGDQVQIPDLNQRSKLVNYTVEQVFNLGFSMPAFALVAKDAPAQPLLIFRGTHLDFTDKSGIASIVADLDLFGPGYSAFFKIESQLAGFLAKQELKGQKTAVLGFSLGGILTVYTGVFFSKFVDLKSSAAFNPPGVQKKLLELSNKEGFIKDFQVYVNQFDPVSKWGFLIGDVAVLSSQDRMGPLVAHTKLMGSLDFIEIKKCDLCEENIRHRYIFLPER